MKKLQKKCFTLIEVVIVIVILVTLASIATPMYMNYLRDANIGAAKSQIATFSTEIDKYYMDTKTYPSELQALIEDVDGLGEKWKGPYLKVTTIPKDPWGNAYEYQVLEDDENGMGYEIRSLGADGAPGGEGEDADISNLGESADE